MSNKFKVDLASSKYPACFTAFDILYFKDKPVTDLPLIKRKELLQQNIKSENERIAITRYIEKQWIALYEAAAQQMLEGVLLREKIVFILWGKEPKTG